MKHSLISLFIPILLSTPVLADNSLCQEEAKTVGYENALDTLPPCKPEQNATAERDRSKEAREGQQPDSAQKPGLESMEQYGQIQIQ